MEKLNSFMKELPKLPDELNVKALDMSILEIEPDWCKYVGESFAQVNKNQSIISILSPFLISDFFLICLVFTSEIGQTTNGDLGTSQH